MDRVESGTELNKNALGWLMISIFVPFIMLTVLLYPYPIGVHGTTHSVGGNEVDFGGERPENSGYFSGDAYIGDNTGWVFCNGKEDFSENCT